MADTILRKELKEYFLEQGIQDKHFFNGRLLTASDLTTVQAASRYRDIQLGRAVGAGVVAGLEVRLVADGSDGRPPVLSISEGLAFNRLGQAVALSIGAEVTLAKEKPGVPPPGSEFEICSPFQQNGKPLPGKGVYLLIARPVSDYQGLAPRRGFGVATKVEGCDRDLIQEGVQFELLSFDLNQLDHLPIATRQALTLLLTQVDAGTPAATAARHRLRNWLAHLCLGSERASAFVTDPFALPGGKPFPASFGIVDALEAQGLLDECDVPLALLCWTRAGVLFVDRWAVRRRLIRAYPGDPLGFAQERLAAEGEAAFLQFQEHLQEWLNPTVPRIVFTLLEAKAFFRYLPAVGILPFTTGAADRGIDLNRFFKGLTVREPIFMEGCRLQPLIRSSFPFRAIDLESEEMIWIYFIRENREPDLLDQVPLPQPYLVFAHGHVPFQGEARFNLSYWNLSNYGLL